MANPESTGTIAQASQIWTMLDDMAEANPAAYRAFIDKHLKEGKEYMQPPKPHMCVQTSTLLDGEEIFINFFGWPRIPKPKSDDAPIPVSGSPIRTVEADTGKCKVCNVAFNPHVLDMFGRDSKVAEEQDALINLAVCFVEDQSGVKLSRNHFVTTVDCKGAIKEATDSLCKRDSESKVEEEMDAFAKSFGPLVGVTKNVSLTEQLKRMTCGETDDNYSHVGEESVEPRLALPGSAAPKRKVVIEEILKKAVRPHYEMLVKDGNSKNGRKIVIAILLPNVTSVQDCQLDVAETEMKLLVPNQYELTLTLPEPVDQLQAVAKFVAASRSLRVTLPTVKSD